MKHIGRGKNEYDCVLDWSMVSRPSLAPLEGMAMRRILKLPELLWLTCAALALALTVRSGWKLRS